MAISGRQRGASDYSHGFRTQTMTRMRASARRHDSAASGALNISTAEAPMDNSIFERIDGITQRILAGGDMTADEGRWLIRLDHDYLPWLMAGADRLRKTFRGDEVEVCAISKPPRAFLKTSALPTLIRKTSTPSATP